VEKVLAQERLGERLGLGAVGVQIHGLPA